MILLFLVPCRTDCGSEHLLGGVQPREQVKGGMLLAVHFLYPPQDYCCLSALL